MKIVIGGQIQKDLILKLVQTHIPTAIVEVKPDIEAALAIKTGEADIYLGSCDTGAGGSLGMAIAILGMDKCLTVVMPGKALSEDEINAAYNRGIKAFGFTGQKCEYVVKALAKVLA